MSRIECWSCGVIFHKKIPLHEGTFPVCRICTQCKTKNYLYDLDNGKINEGCIGE